MALSAMLGDGAEGGRAVRQAGSQEGRKPGRQSGRQAGKRLVALRGLAEPKGHGKDLSSSSSS